jgi:RNA polymerase sigma-70 factor, ECF subfamily
MALEQENNKTFESAEDLCDFGRLYDRYVKAIYRFIYYKTHHKETAEDLTSKTFIKALSKFNSFEAEKGNFTTWLYQIARNTVIDFYRTKKNNLNIEDIWDLSDYKDIERDAHISQQLEDVKKHLNTFSAEQREIIILRVWEDLSYQEIAQITGKTEENCRVSFSRAIAKLRSSISIISLLLLILKL